MAGCWQIADLESSKAELTLQLEKVSDRSGWRNELEEEKEALEEHNAWLSEQVAQLAISPSPCSCTAHHTTSCCLMHCRRMTGRQNGWKPVVAV